MSIKKIVTSLISTLAIVLFFSTYSYAAITDSSTKINLQKSLSTYEDVFTNEREHYNLTANDIIKNNLELGEIYLENTLDINANTNTKKLSEKLKEGNDEYVSTIRLKYSNKPIALAIISKVDSKWVVIGFNSYNLLDNEIANFKKTVNANPIVIRDNANKIFALGSEQTEDNIKMIEPNKALELKKGDVVSITELQQKLKKEKNINPNSVGAMGTPTHANNNKRLHQDHKSPSEVLNIVSPYETNSFSLETAIKSIYCASKKKNYSTLFPFHIKNAIRNTDASLKSLMSKFVSFLILSSL
ncbi:MULTISPECIES: hypothetical protein [Clostridium]|uniref:Uncharacterized protein n=1 Tax=Clostridium frigoriphilum TaxID=443253 RepID=A0ABU7URH9_9CLOT|nr:hypothetical protein [Clostridium sp. DSM 17811]MBU3100984.1 hypothetical protein [Clostridium sp. DSM 17811]